MAGAICRACGSAKVLNVALLGAAVTQAPLGVRMEQMLEALKAKVAPVLPNESAGLGPGDEAGGKQR